jgi:hypothetical protein
MEQLGSLPMPALITFGAVLAVIFGVRYFGLWQGQQHTPTSSAASAQVAAVIVDPTALNKATHAVEALTDVLADAVAVAKEKIRVDTILATELDRIREEMRIQRELNRRESR